MTLTPTKKTPPRTASGNPNDQKTNHMNQRTDPKAAHLLEASRKAAILNPPQPRPKLDAVRVLRRGQFAGVRVAAGTVLPVWPSCPPGWLSAEEAQDLVAGLMAEAATPAEVEAFIAGQLEGGSEP
jgi:hypothetical protein